MGKSQLDTVRGGRRSRLPAFIRNIKTKGPEGCLTNLWTEPLALN
jgi:hypothetical protein